MARRASPRLSRLLTLGADPDDTEDEALAKQILLATALSVASLTVLWYGLLFALGRPWSAAIPLGYQVATYVGIAVLARTRNFPVFRSFQLTMMVLLPPLLQWTLGGFASSGAMIMWAFTPTLGAKIFGARPWHWLGAFAGLAVVSGLVDPWLVDNVEQLPTAASLFLFVVNVLGVAGITFVTIRFFIGQRDEARRDLVAEQAESERLLLNVLPEPIAARLKAGESTIADRAEAVTVLFADVADFTPLAAGLPPDAVVTLLNDVFSQLDELSARHGLEKIKTIGDAYMVVGGLPTPRPDHAEAVAAFALEAMAALERRPHPLQMRMGIDTGPVVAGVIGSTKFAYDLWGDTVNTASRMESHGVPGRIHVTGRVRAALDGTHAFETRGPIEVKGKGTMVTHFLLGADRGATAPAEGDG